jgi:hypothetical protein
LLRACGESRTGATKIDKNYPLKDYHSIFYGEVLAIFAAKSFLRS